MRWSAAAYADTLIGGRYELSTDEKILVLIPMLHRDPSVWGADAASFDPERFSPERERAIPANAYKPFGNGQRVCIGRQFALQEATLVLGMLLQRFAFIDFTDYQLDIKETLTLKPHDFTIKVRQRKHDDRRLTTDDRNPFLRETATSESREQSSIIYRPSSAVKHETPLLVLYGSNLGTAEGVAQELADDATTRRVLACFGRADDAQMIIRRNGAGKSHLPLDRPVALIELPSDYVKLQGAATCARRWRRSAAPRLAQAPRMLRRG